MKSYVERTHFDAIALQVLRHATRLVERVGDHWGSELRCHELARAVHAALPLDCRYRSMVVDGALGSVEHSWLQLRDERPTIATPLRVLLDVYCPGRLPQVQLLHEHWAITRDYRAGAARTDIDQTIIEKLLQEMRFSTEIPDRSLL